MQPVYAHQTQLMSQRGLGKLQPTNHGKFLPGAPRDLGRKTPKTSPPMVVAFLEPLSRPNLPSVFGGRFDIF